MFLLASLLPRPPLLTTYDHFLPLLFQPPTMQMTNPFTPFDHHLSDHSSRWHILLHCTLRFNLYFIITMHVMSPYPRRRFLFVESSSFHKSRFAILHLKMNTQLQHNETNITSHKLQGIITALNTSMKVYSVSFVAPLSLDLFLGIKSLIQSYKVASTSFPPTISVCTCPF